MPVHKIQGYRSVVAEVVAESWGRVSPTDLGYHSPEPRYEGQTSMGACEALGGKECFYDGSGLNAYDAFGVLVAEGSEGLWKFLEKYWHDVFDCAPEGDA